MKIVIFCLILGILATPSFARIGETEEQVNTRYGQPYKTEKGITELCINRFYNFNGFDIMVVFFRGISHSELYVKKTVANSSTAAGITAEEGSYLMKANGGAKQWSTLAKANGFQLADGSIMCSMESINRFVFVTNDYLEYFLANEKITNEAAAFKQMKGF